MAEIPVHCFFVAAYVIRGEGSAARVLLMRRTGSTLEGIWCQVGGKIEAGESAWQAALREIHEETAIVPDELYNGDICEQFYEQDRDAVSVAPVFVAYVPEGTAVTLNEEHSEYGWFTRDEARQLLPFPGQRRILDFVWSGFVEEQPTSWLRIDTEK